MDIAFTLIFTPSKASAYEKYIPDWYKAQNTSPDGYVRPVERLRPLLDEKGINYIYCQDLFGEVGFDETFPVTGIHWNKLAAVKRQTPPSEATRSTRTQSRRSLISQTS